MSVRVLTGDCRDLLKSIEVGSIDCVITDPMRCALRHLQTR